MSATARVPTQPQPLFNRNFSLLWAGQLISQLGNQASALAVMFWLMQATGSPALMGTLLMLSTLPMVIVGPIAGTLVDRLPRLGIIIGADLLRGLMLVGSALLFFAPDTRTDLLVVALFTVATVNGILAAVFQPAISASIPDVVDVDRLSAANGMNQLSIHGAILIGQAVGGVLYRVLGPALLFLFDGLSFLVAALSAAFIRLPPRAEHSATSMKEAFRGYRAATAEGLRFVWHHRGMRAFLLLASIGNFLAMPVWVLLPFYATRHLARGADWYGFLVGGTGAGALISFALVTAIRIEPRHRSLLLAVLFFVMAAGFIALGLTRSAPAAVVIFVVFGFCSGMVNINVATLFQIGAPPEMRGRIMATVLAFAMAATPLGMGFGGVIGTLLKENVGVAALASGVGIGVLTALAWSSRDLREFLRLDPAASQDSSS